MTESASKKRKYKLSATDSAGLRACAFFGSEQGCRSGAACKFTHDGCHTAGSLAAAAAAKAEAIAAVKPEPAAAQAPEPAAPPKKKKKTKQEEVPAPAPAPAAPVAAAAAVPPPQPQEPPQQNGHGESGKKSKKKKAAAPAANGSAAAAVPAAPAAPAEAVENGGTPKRICVFFRKGTCKSGAACQFAHTNGPTRAPSKTPKEKAADKAAKAAAKQAAQAPAVSAPATPAAPQPSAASQAKKSTNRKQPVTPAAAAAAAAAPTTPAAAATETPLSKRQIARQKRNAKLEAAKATTVVVPPGHVVPGAAQPAAAALPQPAATMAPPAPALAAAAPAAMSMPAMFQHPMSMPMQLPYAQASFPAAAQAQAAAAQPVYAAPPAAAYMPPSMAQLPHAPMLPPPMQQQPHQPAASGSSAPPSTAHQQQQQRKRQRSAATPPAAAAAAAPAAATAKPAPPPAAKLDAETLMRGLLRDLPILPHPSPSMAALQAPPAEEAPAAAAAAVPAVAPLPPPPVPHVRAAVWDELVERTRAHPEYMRLFGVPAAAVAAGNGGMAMAGVPLVAAGAASECKKARCSALPQVLALDCEMCETVDDATGARDGKALVRMSIVDGAGTPLVDSLVAPRGRVVDMRTSCHGITPEHLRDCRFTLAHAQAAVARLCCPGTVLVGHALHNDLQALGMVHERVVDTSFLFALEGEGPSATPSLRDLAKAVLDKEIQSGSHSSVTDAVTALEVAQFALDRGAEALPLIKRGCGGGKPKNAGMRAQLLVHRIPLGIKAAHLTTAFTKLVNVAPATVEEPAFPPDAATGRAVLTFASAHEAALVFETLPGEASKDKTGFRQKRLRLANGDYMQVRSFRRGGATTSAVVNGELMLADYDGGAGSSAESD